MWEGPSALMLLSILLFVRASCASFHMSFHPFPPHRTIPIRMLINLLAQAVSVSGDVVSWCGTLPASATMVSRGPRPVQC